MPPVLEAQSLNHWTSREVLRCFWHLEFHIEDLLISFIYISLSGYDGYKKVNSRTKKFYDSLRIQITIWGWLRQQRICLQCRRPRFDPWVRKMPWRRKQKPTPVFLPGGSHGQRSLQSMGSQRVRHDWATNTFWEFNLKPLCNSLGFPGISAGKESTCHAEDLGSVPGLGRSPGEEIGYPLQDSWASETCHDVVHSVAKSQTRLSDWTQLKQFYGLPWWLRW